MLQLQRLFMSTIAKRSHHFTNRVMKKPIITKIEMEIVLNNEGTVTNVKIIPDLIGKHITDLQPLNTQYVINLESIQNNLLKQINKNIPLL